MKGVWSESLCMDITGIVLAVLCVTVAYFKYKFSYWSRRNVPYLEPSIPFGNAKNFILQRSTVGEEFMKIYKKLKKPGKRFAGIYTITKADLLLLDPELVKSVMTKDFQYFADRGLTSDEKKEPLTGHLLALTGAKWKNMRQKLTPTFTSGKIKTMFHTMLSCSNGLEAIMDDYITNSVPIDIKEVLGRFTTDIIGSCAFGLECNSLKDPDAEFRKHGKLALEPSSFRVFKRALVQIFPQLFKLLNLSQVDSRLNDFFMKVVRDTVDYREKNNIKRNDFLQLLINIKNTGNVDAEGTLKEASKGLTLGEMAAQSFLFFLAGFETSSTVMTFFFYDMCLHPDIQEKVRKEIVDMLKRYDGKLTYEGIMELNYLDQVINESMRLHSPVPAIRRICTKDYKIPDSDVIVEKGTSVIIPIYGFQSDPEYYPNPEKFDPERFSPQEKEKRHPFTFLPFGEGPRNCIGLRFGLVQTKVGISVLMKNYRFTLNKKTKTPLKLNPRNVIFAAKGGIWLNAERIS